VPPGGQIKDFTTQCSVVGQGWAMPEAGAEPDLAKALDAAKTERLGLWRTD
jgi:endonuclease YncB( thermonuclease family)